MAFTASRPCGAPTTHSGCWCGSAKHTGRVRARTADTRAWRQPGRYRVHRRPPHFRPVCHRAQSDSTVSAQPQRCCSMKGGRSSAAPPSPPRLQSACAARQAAPTHRLRLTVTLQPVPRSNQKGRHPAAHPTIPTIHPYDPNQPPRNTHNPHENTQHPPNLPIHSIFTTHRKHTHPTTNPPTPNPHPPQKISSTMPHNATFTTINTRNP